MARFRGAKWLRSLLIGLGCLLPLALGWGRVNSQSSTLTVGTEPAFPPFEFQASGGGLQGFDIDLMSAIGQAAGFQVKYQSLPFDGLIPALQAGTVDAAISSITITEERDRVVSFSRPYIGEIVRAGIQSTEVGQSEAAQSLGLDGAQTMRYVIFPQAFRRMLPPLGNEFITLLKDTSLVAVIGFEELFRRRQQLIVAENYRPFELYTAVALVYLVLTLLSSQSFSYLERWMDPARRSQQTRVQEG